MRIKELREYMGIHVMLLPEYRPEPSAHCRQVLDQAGCRRSFQMVLSVIRLPEALVVASWRDERRNAPLTRAAYYIAIAGTKAIDAADIGSMKSQSPTHQLLSAAALLFQHPRESLLLTVIGIPSMSCMDSTFFGWTLNPDTMLLLMEPSSFCVVTNVR